MYIGSHVSIRGGYLGAAKTAYALGGTAFQYFPKNPRSLAVKSFDRRDAEACARFCERNGLLSIAHTPYPTNIATADAQLRQATKRSLINDLEIADACGSVGIVVHFGHYKGPDVLQGYKTMILLLNEVLERWDGNALLLLENLSGEKGRMGVTLEEQVQIRKLADRPDKIGFCFDTCHAFASGLWTGENWDELKARGDELGYFEHVKAVHLNDSLFPAGSFRDRHANVGKGCIGAENIRRFLRSPFIERVPVVLETPATAAYTHQDEVRYVRKLVNE